MQLSAFGRRDPEIDRLAHDRVDEAELRRRAQHVGAGELVGGRGGVDGFEARERRRVRERHVVAEHRDGVCQRRRAGREAPDARVDRLRDRQRPERLHLLHARGADRGRDARAAQLARAARAGRTGCRS